MAYKILITKPTKNALGITTPNDFYLNSDYPLLKVHSSGTFSTDITGFRRLTHSLGYKPFVLVFSQFMYADSLGSIIKSAEYYQHDWIIEGATKIIEGLTKIFANKVDININDTNDGGRPGAINGIYYIFKDEI